MNNKQASLDWRSSNNARDERQRPFHCRRTRFASRPPLGMVIVGGLLKGLGVVKVYPIVVGTEFVFALVLLGIRQLADVDRPVTTESDT
jgi:hypothetical protein